MTSVTDIRSAGPNIRVIRRPLYEPIAAPEVLRDKLGRFGDNYDLNNSSYLYRLLQSLCGETGAGQIKKELLYPRLQSALESTYYSDLDRLYGNPIGLPRIDSEIYNVDPKHEALTQAQWQDVKIKDAQYRSRCLTWMRAIIAGPTPEGVGLAAEAACGVECDIQERYQYLDDIQGDTPVTLQNIGATLSRREFVIIPRTPSLTQAERRRIIRLVDRIRPVNTIPTVYAADRLRSDRLINNLEASSEAFTITRHVTGRSDVDWPDTNPSQGLWITTDETEVPSFAWMDRQETVTFLSIQSIEASSVHTGPFSKDQRQLFGHLRGEVHPYYTFSEENAYARAFAPIQLSVPWLI